MPLLEHPTELRARLLRCIIALLIGMAIAWNYSDALLTFVERPLTGHTYLIEVKAKVAQVMQQHFPEVYGRFKLGQEPAGERQEDRRLNYSAPLEPFFVQIKLEEDKMMAIDEFKFTSRKQDKDITAQYKT